MFVMIRSLVSGRVWCHHRVTTILRWTSYITRQTLQFRSLAGGWDWAVCWRDKLSRLWLCSLLLSPPLIIQTINSSYLPASTNSSYITKLDFCCSCWVGFSTTTPSPSPRYIVTERIMSCEIKEIAFSINLDRNIKINILLQSNTFLSSPPPPQSW